MKGSKIKNGGAVYVGSSLTVYNILRFLLANRDRITDATILLVNKIKVIVMLTNIVHHLVYKNI